MSENLIVTLKHPDGGAPRDLELPGHIRATTLGPLILEALGWPKPDASPDTLVEYAFEAEDLGLTVGPDQTLGAVGVLTGDILTMHVKTKPKPGPIRGPALVSTKGRVFPLKGREITVGRDPKPNGLPLGVDLTGLPGELSVSRQHARITFRGGAVFVEDAGSTNGTRVNDRKINDVQPLKPGDQIQFGDVTVTFQWED